MPPDERVLRRFQILRENLSRLESLRAITETAFLAHSRNVEAAKHLLQVSIEVLIDVAVRLLALVKEPLPDRHAEVFDLLCRHAVLAPARSETYRKMVAFRNRVVHLYDRVDDRRVFGILSLDNPTSRRS